MIKTTGLSKSYGSHQALLGVDLAIPKGTVYGLVGENGAGKTTLLNLLAGVIQPTHGSIVLDVSRKDIALCPDVPQFEPWLTAREVVELSSCLARQHTTPERIDELLATVGLTESRHRTVGSFSRGMTQRLALAATVISEPKLILLDEPCAALDPAGRSEVLSLITNLGKKATVIFSSHILDDVQRVCTSLGMLHDGNLVWHGKLEYLLKDHLRPVWRIRLHGGAEGVGIVLRSLPWVVSATVLAADELQLEARTLTQGEEQLAPALSKAAAAIISIEPVGSNLEDIFLRISERASKEKERAQRPRRPKKESTLIGVEEVTK